MRALLCSAAFGFLACLSIADGWMLKAPYEAKATTSWKVVITANVAGQDHDAKLKQSLNVLSKGEKELKAEFSWVDLVVDGATTPDPMAAWPFSVGPNGAVMSAKDGLDYARMLVPNFFVYPDKEVKAGDKWTSKFKPASDAKEFTCDYEVVEQAKVGDVDALKIKCKLTEDGAMKGDNLYWIGKDGKLLKYEFDLKHWTLPFFVPDIDAKVVGEIVK